MADETPEQIKERVLAEQLAKGSDPRVAEGRAKAAESRARHGLPIEPDAAWRALLEREGGAPSEAAPAAEPRAEEATPAPEPEPQPEAEPTAEAAPAAPAAEAVPEPEPAAAPAPPVVHQEPDKPEPEVGALIEVESEGLEEYAGIKVRDSRLPMLLLVILIVIPMWAIFYLAAFAGSESIAKTSGCVINPDHTFACLD